MLFWVLTGSRNLQELTVFTEQVRELLALQYLIIVYLTGPVLELAGGAHYCTSWFLESLGPDSDLQECHTGNPMMGDWCSFIKESFYFPFLPHKVFRTSIYRNDKNRATVVWAWKGPRFLFFRFPRSLLIKMAIGIFCFSFTWLGPHIPIKSFKPINKISCRSKLPL